MKSMETICCGEDTTNFNTSTGERNRCNGCTAIIDMDTGIPFGAIVTDAQIDMSEAQF